MFKFQQFVLLAALICGLNNVAAQELQEKTALDTDVVQTRIQALRDTGAPEGGMPDGSKTTLDLYVDVMNQLREAQAHAATEKSYTESLTTAPQQESEIRARMDSKDYRGSDIDADSLSTLNQGDLESKLAEIRVSLRDANAAKDNLDRQIATAQNRAPEIQTRIETIDQRLAELPAPDITIQPDLEPSAYEAGQWTSLSESRALVAERHMLEAQLTSQPVRFSRRKVESDELAMTVDGLQYQVQALEAELAVRAQASTSESSVELAEDSPGYETVQRIIGENQELQSQSSELSSFLKLMEEEDNRVKQVQQSLAKQFDTVKQIVALSENSPSLGHVLMTHWHQKDMFSWQETQLDNVSEIGDHVIQRARYEELLALLTTTTDYIQKEFAASDDQPEIEQDEAALNAAKELARARRDLLTELIAVETKLINSHGSIDRTRQQLEEQYKQYRRYLGSRILWVPSHPPISLGFWENIKQDSKNLVDQVSGLRPIHFTPATGLLLILVLLSLLFRKTVKQYVASQKAKVGNVRKDHIGLTFGALLITAFRSLIIPLFLVVLARDLGHASSAAAPYLSSSLSGSARDLFLLILLRISCEPNGLAQLHFNWPQQTCARIRKLTTSLLIWAWPPLLIAALVFRVEVDSVNIVLGRLIFAVAMIVVLVLFTLHFWRKYQNRSKKSRLDLLILLIINSTILFLIIASQAGYIYTGYVLFDGIIRSLALGILLVYFYNFMKRWLTLVNRRMRFRNVLAARQAANDDEAGVVEFEESEAYALSTSISQLLKAGTIILAVIGYAYLWAPLFSALEAMKRVTLWTTSDVSQGEAVITSITLASVAMALFIGILSYSAARTIPSLISLILRSRENVTPGTRYAVAKILEYVIFGAGFIAILSILGLQWSNLQWLVAALGVGIGFGLQEIIANFISGLIILFERPIRVRDIITVGDSSGEVIRIQIRATTIRDFEGKELLVPNKEFVTGRLLNWTLSDSRTRMNLDVGITYGSNARKASSVMEEILLTHPLILQDPLPYVVFKQFGESSVDLRARFYVADVDNRVTLLSDLHHRIYEKFGEEGIVIAFPQLDVHLDKG